MFAYNAVKNNIGFGIFFSVVFIYFVAFPGKQIQESENLIIDSNSNLGDSNPRPFGFRAFGVKTESVARYITKPLPSKNYIHRKPQFIKSYQPVNSSSFKSSFKVDLPNCEMRIAETVPEALNRQAGLRTHRMTTFQAFVTLLKQTKSQFSMLSQWTIDGLGKDEFLFEEMIKAVQVRNVSMKIGFTNPVSLLVKDRYAPGYLTTIENYQGQIQFWHEDSSHHSYTSMHSKLFIADEYEFPWSIKF